MGAEFKVECKATGSWSLPESIYFFEWRCCEHCGCPADQRYGHDDTCAYGCNDDQMTDD